mmetsp:Transcript_859/g.3587  ORF Transcript_859/g.3587 Transcript_859/m.3587 type:complete len:247 (-) Transcript_859:935-1675(-)
MDAVDDHEPCGEIIGGLSSALPKPVVRRQGSVRSPDRLEPPAPSQEMPCFLRSCLGEIIEEFDWKPTRSLFPLHHHAAAEARYQIPHQINGVRLRVCNRVQKSFPVSQLDLPELTPQCVRICVWCAGPRWRHRRLLQGLLPDRFKCLRKRPWCALQLIIFPSPVDHRAQPRLLERVRRQQDRRGRLDDSLLRACVGVLSTGLPFGFFLAALRVRVAPRLAHLHEVHERHPADPILQQLCLKRCAKL